MTESVLDLGRELGLGQQAAAAGARRMLDPRETKYSTVVLDGFTLDPGDSVVVGVNQAQRVGSNDWWKADIQPAAEARARAKP